METVLHIDSAKTWRGGQQQVLYLAQRLTDYHNVIACPPQSLLAERAKAKGLEVLPVEMRGEWDLLAVCKLGKIIRKNSIRIVHLHSPHAHALGLLAAKSGGNCKVVLSRRVDFPIKKNILSRLKYANVDRIIAISQRVKQVLMADGLAEEMVDVVYSGVDTDRFRKIKGDYLISELALNKHKLRIGNIAALAWHKDHRTLVEAARIVVDEFPEVIFLIAGEGPLRREIEILIRKLSLEEKVKLLGFRQDVPEILSLLDLFVMSSSWEGLGTSLLDALASRVPVVSTNVGGIPEIVKDGVNGILVPPGNPGALARAIISLIRNRALAEQMAEEGFQLVNKKFSVDRMVQDTKKIYRHLLV
ncbi:glycosyltransferase [bacterium]|nr:glycosyltransferase [bacterium]NIN92426.1 glycosyltransferase [bacterium]NIO18540.1 glycosyltransferase [bacterium]NIO73536.1 glycosyltransferase [bacterium]